MSRIASAALVLVVAALAPAIAHSQAPAADEVKIIVQPDPATPPVSPARQRAKPSADARQCLAFTTIVEIIKCAEKYLARP